MGKPYKSELAKLAETYSWCMSQDIEELVESVKRIAHFPLVAVGSGGSLSAAEFMASCHTVFSKQLAVAATPLEAKNTFSDSCNSAVWFLSAGGSNIDIRRGFKHFAVLEPKYLGALVGKKESPISEIAQVHPYVDFFDYDLPAGKDGFLATNSLVAFTTLLARAYTEAFDSQDKLPSTLKGLLTKTVGKQLNTLEKTLHGLSEKPIIHLIHSSNLKAGALDIESKFTEAGLKAILLADLRNFAHGRHHWFAKRGNASGIIAISTSGDHSLAEKTLGCLPTNIPQAHFAVEGGSVLAQLATIFLSLYLTEWAGEVSGIDPGNPGVPKFGRDIYGLRENAGFKNSLDSKAAAVRRKIARDPASLSRKSSAEWSDAYDQFCGKLKRSKIGAVVLDYDGTIVDSRKRYRYQPPKNDMAEELNRLLDEGIILGIASGRGKSLRTDLQKIIKRKYWNQVVIGYYNGSVISVLSDDGSPDSKSKPTGNMKKIAEILKSRSGVYGYEVNDENGKQITVRMDLGHSEHYLWDTVHNIIVSEELNDIHVSRSSHSIDIFEDTTRKSLVVRHVESLISESMSVLCIGDRGKWPGNDHNLLLNEYSLGVDEISPSLDACWNIAPAGVRGVQATLFYLKKMKLKSGVIRFHF